MWKCLPLWWWSFCHCLGPQHSLKKGESAHKIVLRTWMSRLLWQISSISREPSKWSRTCECLPVCTFFCEYLSVCHIFTGFHFCKVCKGTQRTKAIFPYPDIDLIINPVCVHRGPAQALCDPQCSPETWYSLSSPLDTCENQIRDADFP